MTAARQGESGKPGADERNSGQAVAAAFHEDHLARQSRRDAGAGRHEGRAMAVTVKRLPPARVAYVRHLGPYGDPAIGRLWDGFAAWCVGQGLQGRPAYGLSHDSPEVTAPQRCRYDACVEVGDDFRADGRVNLQDLPGGLHACTPFEGSGEEIGEAWMALFKGWLPDSGYQADDRPAVEAYGPDLSVDPATGRFRCELCLPVRPL
jgi:AraC family transcriptional regulator